MGKRLLLLAGLLSLLLPGCAAPEPEPRTFSVLYNERESAPFQEDWLILQEYEKRRNVTLDVRTGDDADFERVIAQTLASGAIPDVVLKAWPDAVEDDAASGLLLPFSDYEDLMPHFRSYVAEHGLEDELDKLRLENGKYYILPGYQREIQVQQWIYRRDLFEKHDLGTPGTYDELFNALVFLKQTYPETTPLTASWGGAHLFAMMGAGYGIPAGWNGTRSYDAEADRASSPWQFAPATAAYRAMLRYLHRCYAAGVLDPAIFTQSVDDYTKKVQDGRALVTVTWITSGFSTWNESLAEHGYPDGEWAPLRVPESTIGIRALPAVDPFRKGLIVPSRAANEPYFEDLLAFLDWAVYSEEGMTLTAWGVEGETFEETGEGKAFLPHVKTPKNPDGDVDATAAYGLNTLFNLNENQAFEDYKKPPAIVAFLEASLEAGDTAEMQPRLRMSADDIEAASIIEERLTPYVTASTQGFITGKLDVEEGWDAYLKELERRGYPTLVEIWNGAWEGGRRE